MRRVEATTVRSWKWGARLASAIIRAGYSELRVPEVVATMAYMALNIVKFNEQFILNHAHL